MNATYSPITVTHHTHAGYEFVEFQGSYFKGCKRCGGTGHYSFNGFDSICYACGNTSAKLGDPLDSLEAAQKWCEGKAKAAAARAAKREQERLAKIAKRNEAWQALKDEHPTAWELLSSIANVSIPFDESQYSEDSVKERSAFLRSMADKLFTLDQIRYTPRQIEVIEDMAAQRVAKAAEAAATPAPAGRVPVTGEIISTKVVEGDYGTAYKIMVKDDQGFRVYVSLPKAQADEAYDAFLKFIEEIGSPLQDWGSSVFFTGSDNGHYAGVKGRRIAFTATLAPSDDVSMAWGSRPSKGAWL